MASQWWWILALILVGLELTTGTVYLLMIALGLLAAGLVAHFDYDLTLQLLGASIVAVAGCLLVKRWHASKNTTKNTNLQAQRNQDVQIDIGNVVTVQEWEADGITTVQYRGAQWTAKIETGHTTSTGAHRIVAIQGNALILVSINK